MPTMSLQSPSALYFLVTFLHFTHPTTATPTTLPTIKFSYIQTYASVGDSYAAGLGAGIRGPTHEDYLCSRYSHSYPSILYDTYLSPHASGHFNPNPDHSTSTFPSPSNGNSNSTHHYLPCSGATTTDVLNQVLGLEDKSVDLMTISAGGNDIGLSPILNACIFQWFFEGEGECKRAVTDARRKLDNKNTDLYASISTILQSAKSKMKTPFSTGEGGGSEGGVIYLTGYASFFGTSDHICDNVTWAVWRNLAISKQFLKLDLRKQLNQLVWSVNAVLKKAAQDAGPNVRFIDYDAEIGVRRGRYCEEGVVEPEPNRANLSFYEWDTVDADLDNTSGLLKTGEDVVKGSFEGEIAAFITKTLEKHPDWEFDPRMGHIDKQKLEKMRAEGIIGDTIWWLLPDKWKRVFHPRPEAHGLIAKMIVEDLEERERVKAMQEGRDILLRICGVGVILFLLGLALWLLPGGRDDWREKQKKKYERLTETHVYTPTRYVWGKRWKEREEEDRDFCDTETLAEEPLMESDAEEVAPKGKNCDDVEPAYGT